MQILGKRSKVLLIVISVAMLVAIGVSFAAWDSKSAVKAASGNSSTYANAKVGDIITFGNYYQTGNKVSDAVDAEYEKTPIEWIVVDKDERTGQLTLMSKYILAAGSYFGNYYKNELGDWGFHYSHNNLEVSKIPYNQAYVDSTTRAFLNNLERKDLGGDSYSIAEGYKTSTIASVTNEKLYSSVGFSNRKYSFTDAYQRPIGNPEYRERPAVRGFFDEAFTDEEKSMIVPKAIAGYTGHRWPINGTDNPTKTTSIEGSVDKVWLPSTTELNIMNEDNYTNPSDESSSTVFEYFKDLGGVTLEESLKTVRTPFVTANGKAMNFSIPIYKYQSTEINEDIHATLNSTDQYWTRSPSSFWSANVCILLNSGAFNYNGTVDSTVGVRPCVILKY